MRATTPAAGTAEEFGDDPDWEALLPDDEETYPEPGDFWIEPDEPDEW